MLDAKQINRRKEIVSFLKTVTKLIEEDEEFAKKILCELDVNLSSIKKDNKKMPSKPIPLNSIINIFDVFQNKGPEGLKVVLQALEVNDLKRIVVENGLDPAQKVRRWRVKEKIVNHIVEAVCKQMAKGGAFLKNNTAVDLERN
nr:hypothetical protein [Neobacillus sp. Marseille-Q6967]